MERSRMIREEYTVFLCIILETTEFDIIKYHMFGIKKRSHNFQLHIYLLCMSEELGNMVPSFVYTLSTFCTPHAKSLQSCLTLCHPMNCSPPGSSVQGILQARILEQVAVLSSRESFQSRDQTRVSLCLLYWQAGSLSLVPLGKPPKCMQCCMPIISQKTREKNKAALSKVDLTLIKTPSDGKPEKKLTSVQSV